MDLFGVAENIILRMVKGAHEFSRSKEKINHLLYLNDLKLQIRNEKDWKR